MMIKPFGPLDLITVISGLLPNTPKTPPLGAFLVDAGAVDQLAEALATLAADPALRDRMGAAGRSRVLPRYAVDRLVDDVDRLYRALLNR
jgi:glycosyltransferase involved in cell wall biosynthesis